MLWIYGHYNRLIEELGRKSHNIYIAAEPIPVEFDHKYTQKHSAREGVVDSLQGVLYKDDFLNRESTTHILAESLTRF